MFYDKKEHCYYGTYEINWTDETRHFEMINDCTTISPSEFQLEEEEELNRMIDMNIRAVEKLKTLTSFDDVVFEQTTETSLGEEFIFDTRNNKEWAKFRVRYLLNPLK